MSIEYFETYEDASKRSASVLTDAVATNPNAHLCLATGASPLGAYRIVADRVQVGLLDFSQVRVTKLDEWLGVATQDPVSCEAFLRQEVIGPWKIQEEHYLAFDSEAEEPAAECRRIDARLCQMAAFDVCVLGIGINGHIGLNEPSDWLHVDSHLAELAAETAGHSMLRGKSISMGLTLGLGSIMCSKTVLLIVHGESKRDAWKSFLESKVTTRCPASLLKLHPNLVCLTTLALSN